MIFTLTFNPAVDYYITVDNFASGKVNRTQNEQIRFGGKGINVSLVLKEFGVKSVATGFIGGSTGEVLENHLTQSGIDCDFVKVCGNTRINVKLNDTDINATGPDISSQELQELYTKLDNLCDGDFLVVSGNVPRSLPQNTYEIILERLKHKGIKFVVDAEKELLVSTLKYSPFLIKPNHHELGDIFGIKINNFDDAVFYAKKLQEKGAKNVLVSLGENGAVLVDENKKFYTQNAPQGAVVSTVGSGDSMVAAFLAEHINGGDYKMCLKMAVAAGSATAFSDGLAVRNAIKKIYKNI